MSDKIKWLVHLFFSLLLFLLFSVLGFLAYVLDSGLELGNKLNHVWHGKLIHAEPPGILEDKVGSDIFITSVQSGGKELFFLSLNKEPQQVLNDFSVIGLSGGVNGITVHFIFFR